jgi:CheY-like chemotaxis protein
VVTIVWRQDEAGDLLIDWTESEGPAVTAPTRRGFGSTIIEQSIPFDLGGRAEIAYRVTGLSAHFCIPARHIAGLAKSASPAGAVPDAAVGTTPLAGKTVLLVEDSMIIALDAEDALREIGAAKVVVAASVARALAALDKGGFGFALLDLNLGSETSTAVADALQAQEIPFAFATGYGEDAPLAQDYPAAPVLNKPYTADHLRKALAGLRL